MIPDVSVVMAVRNGGTALTKTIESILGQSHHDLEFIIVDDGSTDSTALTLRDMSLADSRVIVLTQEAAGLTRALINGCARARAPLVARQDAGDVSLPDRLESSIGALRDSTLALWSSEVEYVGPAGEPLYVTRHCDLDIRHSLLHDQLETITSLPHHGSAVFRKHHYESAGGYRAQFWFAQDLDLWIRLAAYGRVEVTPAVMYQARVEERSISSTSRPQQLAATAIMLRLRDSSGEVAVAELLERAASIRPSASGSTNAYDGAYFIGAILARNGDKRARSYLRKVLRANPIHPGAWYHLLRLL